MVNEKVYVRPSACAEGMTINEIKRKREKKKKTESESTLWGAPHEIFLGPQRAPRFTSNRGSPDGTSDGRRSGRLKAWTNNVLLACAIGGADDGIHVSG
jgi:hypothetical protein